MSGFRFGIEYYSLDYHPSEAADESGVVDWEKVDCVEIDWVKFVRERITTRHGKYKTRYGRKVPLCECCGYAIGDDRYNFCPKCGARMVE